MTLVYAQTEDGELNWREALLIAVESGLPGLFNIEWLIEKAETREWGGVWW